MKSNFREYYFEIYKPQTFQDKKMVDGAKDVKVTPDADGNGDDVFKGTNVKTVDRKKERHGNSEKEAMAAYESAEQIDELSSNKLKSYLLKSTSIPHEYDIKGDIKHTSKSLKHDRGMNRALDKLQNRHVKVPATNEEQIDELSKNTLKSYIKKSQTSSDRAWARMDREEDKAMSTDGEKYPEKQERHNQAAREAHKVWKKRDSGLSMADMKMKDK